MDPMSVIKEDAQFVLFVNLNTREAVWCNSVYVLLVVPGPVGQHNILTYRTDAPDFLILVS